LYENNAGRNLQVKKRRKEGRKEGREEERKSDLNKPTWSIMYVSKPVLIYKTE